MLYSAINNIITDYKESFERLERLQRIEKHINRFRLIHFELKQRIAFKEALQRANEITLEDIIIF